MKEYISPAVFYAHVKSRSSYAEKRWLNAQIMCFELLSATTILNFSSIFVKLGGGVGGYLVFAGILYQSYKGSLLSASFIKIHRVIYETSIKTFSAFSFQQ